MMSSGRIAQHRNYGEVMARHERDQKMKRVVRVFIYFLIIALLLTLFFIVKNWEGKRAPTSKPTATIEITTTINRVNSTPI